MGKDKFTKQPEIVAAIISVIGTLVGTLLIGVFLGFMEGRLGLGPVVAVITLLLVLCIWGLLAFRWGGRVAGAAAAAMVIVGSVVFLIATAARFIPFGVPSATPVAAGASPTPAPLPPTPTPSPAEEGRPFIAGECRIAYKQDGDVYVRNCDGSGVYQVTNHPAEDGSPGWSPDGERIVFYSDRDGQAQPEGSRPPSLYIVDADGSNLTQLTHTEDNDHGPSWSPDGSRIAFHRNCELAVIDSDGSNPRVILKPIGEECVEYPVWSPDGERLSFVSGRWGPEGDFDSFTAWVVKADGTGLVKLDEFQGRNAVPAWSPDGSQVAVKVGRAEGGEYRLMMNADGSGETVEVESIPDSWYPWHWPQWGGAAQARAFAEPILAAIAGRPPTWSEEFSDSGSGWPIGSTADGDEWGYEDDAYFISATYLPQGGCCIGASPDRAPSFSDFVLEVDARFVSGEWGFWNVIFRDSLETLEQPVGAAYGVMFSPDGAFNLHKNVGGVHINLVGHFPHAPTFERGFETNHLTIIAQGPQIAVYVNGEPLWFVYDESSSRGMISMGVENDTENTTLRVHFDNLKVWDISALVLPGETPAPLPSTPPSSFSDQARAFAAPILAAMADRPPDFEDDFTTADKGWDLFFPGKPPNGDRLEITDGVVRMTLFEGTEGMLTRLDWMWLKDFVLMVDSRQVSGSYGSPQMVVWGNPDDTWGQVAIQSGTASWNLSKGPGDQWPPWPKGSGDVVSPIGETNHILIVARGPQLAIYLNDVPVAYVEDQEIDVAWTKALSFNCGGQPDMVCEFDNVKLWNLDNVPGLP